MTDNEMLRQVKPIAGRVRFTTRPRRDMSTPTAPKFGRTDLPIAFSALELIRRIQKAIDHRDAFFTAPSAL